MSSGKDDNMRISVVAFSTNGCRTALRIRDSMPDHTFVLACKTTSDTLGIDNIEKKTIEWVGERFTDSDAIVFIGAVGIAVRYIAPYIRRKDTDPAVICMDEHGTNTIPILSGHIGGGNRLAREMASSIDSNVIITTATDINGKLSIDTFATEKGLRIGSLPVAKDVSARILDGGFIGFVSHIPVITPLAEGLTATEEGELGICISYDSTERPFTRTLNLTPMDITIGIGCKRDTDPQKLYDFVIDTLRSNDIDSKRVGRINSIDLKSDEPAILRLAERLKAELTFYTADELMSIEGEFTSSDFVKSITSVDCVCERSAAMSGDEIVLRKTARDGMTIALCRRKMSIAFD